MPASVARAANGFNPTGRSGVSSGAGFKRVAAGEVVDGYDVNPLGRMPGSFWALDDDCGPGEGPVWELSAEPFKPPPGLGEHFAAFPSEIPRRCILGWTTTDYCTACNQPRRPLVDSQRIGYTESAIWPRQEATSDRPTA